MTSTRDFDIPTYDGIKLRGTLYCVGQQMPCIIMSSGWSGLRTHFIPDFAARFNAAGYGVLAYDNRGWGESEGTPREEVDPWLQTRDYFDAFNFATVQPEIDATKIVYWGSSMSGGNAVCAAAINKKIAAVILQVPFVSGEAISRGPGMDTSMFVLERGKAVAEGAASKIDNFPSSMEELMAGTSKAVLRDPEAIAFMDEMKRRGMDWSKTCTVQSLTNAVLHEPIAYIHRISPTPMLMIASNSDVTTQTHLQLQMYEKALEPKTLKILKGVGHFSPYYGETFEINIKAQLDFLKETVG
ncbi:Alpha/Beta hydrolase protein [Ilyonectria robusta]|uniref:Alpha/Beta hydrolase protein n=1 Tax=Ilyonectria robusta TaxID=1079257 RepID=UPI001E8EAF28|nr:Alpha/Beta hydrolase protein [Ilyonectria robusta]KAH8664920.1 Alpha/Beta hydrolase protein [Ilyonectria robusta]